MDRTECIGGCSYGKEPILFFEFVNLAIKKFEFFEQPHSTDTKK